MRIENEVVANEWDSVSFEENVEILSGFPFDSSKFNDSVGMPLIRIRNILSGTTDTFFDGEFQDDFIIKKGDILVGMDGDFHIKKWTGVNALLNQRNLKLYNNGETQIDLNFFFYLAQPFLLKVHNRTSGTTVKHLSTKDFRKASFKVPPLPEQQKIAEILSTVDEKIEAIDQRISETQDLKKGLMQQLLTKGISHTQFKDSPLGEIPESWEVAKLEDVCLPKVGMRRGPFGGAIKKEYFVEDGFQVYEQRNAIYDDFESVRYFIDEEKYNELKAFRIKENDFIVSCSGTIGKIAKVPANHRKGVINQALLRLRLDRSLIFDDYFLQQFRFEPFQNKITDSTQGGAMKNLVGMSVFRKTLVTLPPVTEQQKIAEILSSVDEKLQIQQDKKAEYQELKKGLMQQLLTGKMRVKV